MNESELKTPVDYVPGYEKARLIDQDLADLYVAHTLIGDPPADALVEALTPLGAAAFHQLLTRAMSQDSSVFQEAPRELRDFFDVVEEQPEWANQSTFESGVHCFHRNSELILQGLVGGSLVEGFSTNIARSFVITGRLREQGVRRLRQNNRHVLEIFMPGGLENYGDGWKLSVRLRLVHAQVRHLLNDDRDDWDTEAWGTPLSSAHMGFAASAFSARTLRHARKMGVKFSREESESFMQVWLYAMKLMGIPEALLPRSEADALELYRVGGVCEPPPDFESIIMANALMNAAPPVLGVTDDQEKKELLKLAYGISRALIGDELADQLKYPQANTRFLLMGARVQTRFNQLADMLLRRRGRRRRFNRFVDLISAAAYDPSGISYRMPDHVYAERSTRW